MGSKHIMEIVCLFFMMRLLSTNAQGTIFNVMQFGAKGDGVTDDSQAIVKAWKAACSSVTPSTVFIPNGRYASGPVKFEGPCKAETIAFTLQGTMLAPPQPERFTEDGWVVFQYVNGLVISGGGTFDGQGALAWSKNDCAAKIGKCTKFAINIRLNMLNNSVMRDVTSLNSKLFHMNVLGCNSVLLERLKIIAPENSPNTDGIHVGRTFNLTITDTVIQTGDDCISLGDGSEQVMAERVTCGPGHGFSIGSLGHNPGELPVTGVTVRNCNLTGTQNGVRVKTWPASAPGAVSDLRFEEIYMNNVSNPILIDQYYCPYLKCQADIPSHVQISNVVFKNIFGTSASQSTVKMSCSPAKPCQNVVVSNVNLRYTGPPALGPAFSECANVKPVLFGNIYPPPCAKKAHFP